MSEKNDLFGRKHATLWRISMWMNGLAPVFFFVFILLALGEIFQYSVFARNQFQTDLSGLFTRNPLYIVDLLLQMTRWFLQGAFYYLVLKGIALGLDMIVETDVNYREKKIEEGEL